MICDNCQRKNNCQFGNVPIQLFGMPEDSCTQFIPKICERCVHQPTCKKTPDYYGSCSGYIKKRTAIADSGHRTEFATGAVRDMHAGKGRYDLLPWDAIHELAIHCEQGAKKYGERNCEKGIPVHSLIDSAIRHLSCYLRGMKDEPHLRAALWNVAFAIWMEKNRPEQQDIPARKGVE